MQEFPLTTPLDIILSYNAIFTSSLHSLYYNFSLFKMLIQCFFELFFILGRKLIYINLWRLKNFSIYYYYIHNVIIYIYIYIKYLVPIISNHPFRHDDQQRDLLISLMIRAQFLNRLLDSHITIIYNLENNGPSLESPLKQKKIRWNLNEDSALPATGEHAVPWTTWSESLDFSIGIYTWPMYSLARANLYRRNRLDSNLKAIVIQFKY